MKRKVYTYQRYSSQAQKGNSSLYRQTEAQNQWFQRHPDCILESQFSDEGVSAYHGKNATVGELGGFLEKVKQGFIEKGSILLIEHFSRLTRQDIDEAEVLIKKLWDGGITIALTKKDKMYEPEDANALQARFELLFEIKSAHEDSAYRSLKVKGSYERRENDAAVKGKGTAIRRPFWLNKDGTSNEYKCIVQSAFQYYLRGIGQRNILRMLKTDYPDVELLNKTDPTTVMRWLSSPTVIGRWRDHDIHEPIVDEETFNLVQDIRLNKRFKNVKPDSLWPLSGLIRCKGCGCSMSIQKNYHGGLPVLRCSRTQRMGEKPIECTSQGTFPLLIAHKFFFTYALKAILIKLSEFEINKDAEIRLNKLNVELTKQRQKHDVQSNHYDSAIEDGNQKRANIVFSYMVDVKEKIDDIESQINELTVQLSIKESNKVLPDLIDLLQNPMAFNTEMHRLGIVAYLDSNTLFFDEGIKLDYLGYSRSKNVYPFIITDKTNGTKETLSITSRHYTVEDLMYPLNKMSDEEILTWKQSIDISNRQVDMTQEEINKAEHQIAPKVDELLAKRNEIDTNGSWEQVGDDIIYTVK
jgi:hypothetical protein